MALTLTGAPAVEPVSVSEAKTHLRIDGNAEDILIASLIVTSRLHVEAALGLALISQEWRLTLDKWPEPRWSKGGAVRLPLRPVRGIDEVRVRGADGTPDVLPPERYLLDQDALTPRLVPHGGGWPVPGLPTGGIEIDFEAGMGEGPADVPEPIRHAILLLVAHWYEHRDPMEIGSIGAAIPQAVSDLLKPYREVRL
ncbi:head-tail connector protein [Hyphomicrobium sp.]|mgnify:CR=1 FL=1|uniref:head-tail connector protein n=1 Tax=Hyphomicrobium sp. TaxID=82 RepID=UPI002C0C8DA3|nr:head-tail connector protein [Hyphomicrobium sp.]HRN88676.1 head-tail connector protein [Hyphomicrobium sp.]HRQ26291.1 head-tail connector protein [Hyphomicrobium sp.]